jgi:hypothetical protein
VERVVSITRGRPVLLVGDQPRFCDWGGMLNFYIEEDRVRFEVNPARIEQAGLTAHSRLLNLARVVTERGA